ncbi:MAG: TaqI-like C-terminal specificity domain-containing protein [bacterium]
MPYDVFGAYVDTVIVIARQTDGADAMGVAEALPVDLVVFPPRYKITALEDFEVFKKTGDAAEWLRQGEGEFLVTLSAEEQEVISKIDAVGSTFGDVMDIQRGVTPFKTTAEPPPQNPARAFVGTVRRYRMPDVTVEFIRYDESLAEYKPAKYFRGPRLLLREMISRQFRLQAILVQEDFVTNKSMQSLLLTDNRYDIRYCLGLLNSKLLSWYFLAKQSVARRDDFPKIVLKQSRGLPFRSIDFGNSEERGAHDRLAGLVEHMLQLHRKAERTEDEQERKPLQKQIAATDRQVDELVYELYGLTEKEIQTVEAPEDA